MRFRKIESEVGETEKKKYILFSRSVSSELYKYILPGGIYNSASNKNSFISNEYRRIISFD